MKAQPSLILLVGILLIGVPGSAWGQDPFGLGGYYGGYTDNPVGPTVSPYSLLSNDQFGMSNYYTLVRPLEQQQAAIRQHGAALERLQREERRSTSGSRSNVASPMRSTGTAASQPNARYQNFSHYFNFKPTR